MAGLPKLLKKLNLDGQHVGWLFWCPACSYAHWFRTVPDSANPKGPLWFFNGNEQSPSFTASLLVNGQGQGKRCHLVLTDGKLNYCSDSEHEFAGRVTDLVDWPFSGEKEG